MNEEPKTAHCIEVMKDTASAEYQQCYKYLYGPEFDFEFLSVAIVVASFATGHLIARITGSKIKDQFVIGAISAAMAAIICLIVGMG